LGRLGEAARERAVVPELPGERIVVDRQLVCYQLTSGLVVAGYDTPDCRVRGHRSRRARSYRLTDPELVALALRDELDPVRAHVDEVAHLSHPRQHADLRSATSAEEHVGKGVPLRLVPGRVDVQHDRPR